MRGQALVEYALVFLLVALAVVAALALVAPVLAHIYQQATNAL
jgi:Flp pilus assembly pilin Flp